MAVYAAQHHAMGEVVKGLLYVDPEPSDLHQHLGTVEVALNRLGVGELSPGREILDRINRGLR